VLRFQDLEVLGHIEDLNLVIILDTTALHCGVEDRLMKVRRPFLKLRNAGSIVAKAVFLLT
jgi:hypothetical protein